MTPFILFPKDDYINNYITSIHTLLASGDGFLPAMQALKLRELLLYLYQKHASLFASFQSTQALQPDDYKIKQVVQENIANNLTIDELAFLCNMSVATFKRKFYGLYHSSPARWLQLQRLQMAADLLNRKKAKPADVYMNAGYENHSSFSQAFKACYGVAPKDYQGQQPI